MKNIYCIQQGHDGPVKIGLTSADPAKRLAQLQTANPFLLSLIGWFSGPAKCEAMFHRAFADYQLVGEWFDNASNVIAAFKSVEHHSNGIPTIPPKTKGGRQMLQLAAECGGARERYPDGSTHAEIDWDELSKQAKLDTISYDAWLESEAA